MSERNKIDIAKEKNRESQAILKLKARFVIDGTRRDVRIERGAAQQPTSSIKGRNIQVLVPEGKIFGNVRNNMIIV